MRVLMKGVQLVYENPLLRTGHEACAKHRVDIVESNILGMLLQGSGHTAAVQVLPESFLVCEVGGQEEVACCLAKAWWRTWG